MKKKILITLATLGVAGLLAGFYVVPSFGSDEPPIIQEVRHQGETLDNHEDRITNAEGDITDLQSNTGTPPSSTRVVVREVTTPSPDEPIYTPPEPQPTPVTVASYTKTNEPSNLKDTSWTFCNLTYSDGSKFSFLWQEKSYNQAWVTKTHGTCDNSIIGRIKANTYTGYQ